MVDCYDIIFYKPTLLLCRSLEALGFFIWINLENKALSGRPESNVQANVILTQTHIRSP